MSGNQTDYAWKRTNTPQEHLAREMASIKKGDTLWCTLPRLAKPMKGTIIAITNTVGKQIGLEFEEEIGGHSCDGRGKEGHCLWCNLKDLATDTMVENILKQRKVDEEMAAKREVAEEVESLDLTAGLETP